MVCFSFNYLRRYTYEGNQLVGELYSRTSFYLEKFNSYFTVILINQVSYL